MRYLLVFALFMCGGARAADRAAEWGPVEYLIGDWIGEGGGGPGRGSGWFSFKPDLQGKVLVRKNHAEYPATKERGTAVHDDLMVIYKDAGASGPDAIYFDSEGHTIRYKVQAAGDGGAIVFLSSAEAATPRYRLTYSRVGQDRVKIKFEIAPPGKPDEFTTYIEAGAHRKK